MDAWPCCKKGCQKLAAALIRYHGEEMLVTGVTEDRKHMIVPQVQREICDAPTCSDHLEESVKILTELKANPQVLPLDAPLPHVGKSQAVVMTQEMPKLHEMPDTDGPWREAVDELRERVVQRQCVGPPETADVQLQEATILDWSIKAFAHVLGARGGRYGRMWSFVATRPGPAKRVHLDALMGVVERLGAPEEYRRPISSSTEKNQTAVTFMWIETVEGAPPTPPAPAPKIGRNDPCPCGSGAKFKKCCMRQERP